jgi:hypothetical protein
MWKSLVISTIAFASTASADPANLTDEEHELLAQGEIGEHARLGGTAVEAFFGLGLGQAVEGRWTETGWIFTTGELAATTLIGVGLGEAFAECKPGDTCHAGRGKAMFVAGALAAAVFRTWGTVDAYVGPARHDERVRALRMRLATAPMPYVTTLPGSGGTIAGFTLAF